VTARCFLTGQHCVAVLLRGFRVPAVGDRFRALTRPVLAGWPNFALCFARVRKGTTQTPRNRGRLFAPFTEYRLYVPLSSTD
jgi:hypothetical protein